MTQQVFFIHLLKSQQTLFFEKWQQRLLPRRDFTIEFTTWYGFVVISAIIIRVRTLFDCGIRWLQRENGTYVSILFWVYSVCVSDENTLSTTAFTKGIHKYWMNESYPEPEVTRPLNTTRPGTVLGVLKLLELDPDSKFMKFD